MSHTHDHGDHNHGDHPHDDHAPVVDLDAYVLLERAVRELLVEKGLIDPERLRRQLDQIDSTGPMLGALLVARAWADDTFRALLISDPKAAALQCLGIKLPDNPEIAVLADTETVHHVVVCTLCSCYPKALLGLPPDWYKSFAYRSRMVVEPRAILARFGTTIAPNVELRVMDSTSELRYLVLPVRPAGTEGWSEQELLKLITRDSMIGVTFPTAKTAEGAH
jgi:hypothetical protein